MITILNIISILLAIFLGWTLKELEIKRDQAARIIFWASLYLLVGIQIFIGWR